MLVALIASLVVNTLAFAAIAKLLPGFSVKKPETAIVMAVVYGVLTAIATKLLGALLVGALVALFLLVPFLGFLGFAAAFLSAFLLNFAISVAVLLATDALLDDFEMDGPATAVIASLLLGLIGGALRAIF